MVRLRRSVRFSINPDESTGGLNGDGGIPSSAGLSRGYELEVTCSGTPDPVTGYLINIKAIDRAVRDWAVPIIADACNDAPTTHPGLLLPVLAAAVGEALPVAVESVRWWLTPTLSMEVCAPMPSLTTPPVVLVRQRFDLACAHRLHNPALSDDENRRLFGKCNNPAGHGHNYRVEPCIEVGFTPDGLPGLGTARLEAVVDEAIVQPFDHTHLNHDTEAFRDGSGLNPSVENIARVFYERLAPAVREASPLARLVSVTVWETDRTAATFPA